MATLVETINRAKTEVTTRPILLLKISMVADGQHETMINVSKTNISKENLLIFIVLY